MNFAYSSSCVFTDSSTLACIVTDFGCLGGALMIAMLSYCSSLRFCLTSCLTTSPIPSSLRGQNTSCEFQRQEAGVTPEALRDRAAILRHDGVAPASDRVLAALRFPALFRASACSFCRLPFRSGEVGREISGERPWACTFPGRFHQGLRMTLEHGHLAVQ